ncbi:MULTISPECIES: hypothetical protein [Bacillaceae]|uniref:Uncharacterized protein n=1 Tax=Evansella alkalicola TaxID=745819 RepID=A0ABS6JXY9_9BACI|nr:MULTISPECIES: hypothetical protein [Bacillaceae]MBU9722956.1 hypothetical protein [Bacillus alkalicola]
MSMKFFGIGICGYRSRCLYRSVFDVVAIVVAFFVGGSRCRFGLLDSGLG